ncbi:MAG: iron ABC transporter permease [Gemmataceae bacterium]|nr:iron ABC transporter permease [Gemmataceae bacterium]
MSGWRLAYGLGLVAFVTLPLLLPLGELLAPAAWTWTTNDAERLFQLALNTLALTAGTVALSFPIGIGLAIVLFRTSFPFRRVAWFLLALALFVPLPIVVSSWQAVLGAHGWSPLDFWRDSPGRPWASGLAVAIWIHALAAAPWVAFLVGVGVASIEPGLEDEAALSVGPWRVLAFVTLPRMRASILGAALFVVLQTAGETSVTEMMQVATLAEEMRTQFATTDDGLARTLLVVLPSLLLAWAGVLVILSYLEKSLPPLVMASGAHRSLELGQGWLRLAIAAILIGLLLVPLGGLFWRLGLTGHPPRWDAGTAAHFLRVATVVRGDELIASLITSIATGMAVASVAVVGCWLARERAWFRWLLFGVLTWVWVLPGPAVGMALQETILWLPNGPWKDLLYFGSSPAPLIWAQAMRSLPIAVVFLWPVVRMIPRELFEEARLAGAAPLSEFLHIVVPTTWRATLVTGLGAAALCLGEVGASERVATAGWEAFASTLLKQMHTGVDNNVSALCVLALLAIAGCGAVVGGASVLIKDASKNRR